MSSRTCVITGGSRGIGLATALCFARQGDNVVVAGRDQAALDDAIEQLSAAGAEALAVAGDVSEPAVGGRLIEQAIERFGRIDVLVNNAGRAPLAEIEDLDPVEFDQATALNIGAVFHLTRTAWPHLRRQGGGVIVNVSSRASVDPFPGFAVYGASKAWVNLFSQAMAAEGRPHGIRVYAIAPGAVETQLMRSRFPDLPADKALAPDAVAVAIESVTRDALAAATGQTIFLSR